MNGRSLDAVRSPESLSSPRHYVASPSAANCCLPSASSYTPYVASVVGLPEDLPHSGLQRDGAMSNLMPTGPHFKKEDSLLVDAPVGGRSEKRKVTAVRILVAGAIGLLLYFAHVAFVPIALAC